MPDVDLSLYAHLMRRAGFGASREELEACAAKGYEATVEDLLHPERFQDVDLDIIERYNHARPDQHDWMYRMVNTGRPLGEKMALFWHHVFATGMFKSDNPQASYVQIDTFRREGLSDMGTILTELSKDPAMLFWLDNNENLKEEPNENYGRELLELFSMGVGNYTEDDVKGVTRSFTGWTFKTNIPGKIYPSYFIYLDGEHDTDAKSFLGETGRFNGEDIVGIIVKQPACARFVSRYLYTYFVADEPPVASWNETPPQDPEAIDTLVRAYLDSGGQLRSVLRTLFNSEFFKQARFKRVKSPVELITGLVKLTGTCFEPDPDNGVHLGGSGRMGQSLMDPLTVEGWHTGQEWIDGGTLNERVNHAVDEVSDPTSPGIQAITWRLADEGTMSPHRFVDRCLDLAGPLTVGGEALDGMISYAESGGDVAFGTDDERQDAESRVVRMLQLIVSAREYQMA